MSLKQTTRATQDLIAQITDPYHDKNIPTQAYPDATTLYAAIRRWALRLTVAYPGTLAAGEKWDFHIFSLPIHFVATYQLANLSYSAVTDASASTITLGPLNVRYRAYNAAGTITNEVFVPLGPPAVQNNTLARECDTQRRFVSFGYELHNTTAEIYRAGSLTTYRTNYRDDPISLVTYNQPSANLVQHQMIARPPFTLDEANLIPGSRTWRASEGAYVVCLPHHHNTLSSSHYRQHLVNIGPLATSSTPTFSLAAMSLGASTNASSFSPLHCAGVYSSKFPDINQTFSLDIRMVLEEVPNPSSADMSYAIRSPEYTRS